MPAGPDGRRDRQRVESPTQRRRRPTVETSVFSSIEKPTFSMVVAQAPTSEFVSYLTISESYLSDF
jgi:hypothetical protein